MNTSIKRKPVINKAKFNAVTKVVRYWVEMSRKINAEQLQQFK